MVGSSREVEFPDGTIHQFDSTGRLAQIRDRFSVNTVSIVYTQPWTISDNHGRVQRIYFKTLPQAGGNVDVVDRVELTTTNPTVPATYTFGYTSSSTTRRPCPHNDPTLSDFVQVQLLTSVTCRTAPPTPCRAATTSSTLPAQVRPAVPRARSAASSCRRWARSNGPTWNGCFRANRTSGPTARPVPAWPRARRSTAPAPPWASGPTRPNGHPPASRALTATLTTYDSAGNLTAWNGAATYDYDAFNQMWRMKSGNEEWLYVYTADDQRVWTFKVGE